MLNIYYSAVHCSRYFYHSWVFLKRKPFFFVIFHWTWIILLCWSYVGFLVLFFKGCWCRSMKCVNSSISMVLTQLLSKHGRVKRQNLSWNWVKCPIPAHKVWPACTKGSVCVCSCTGISIFTLLFEISQKSLCWKRMYPPGRSPLTEEVLYITKLWWF